MEKEKTLSNADYRLLDLVWDTEPVASPELCKLAEERLGWKRTTTYTVIKRLCEKSFLQSEATVITAPVKREEVQRRESSEFLDKTFGGSLPAFLAAFAGERGISEKEADELHRLIDRFSGGRGV